MRFLPILLTALAISGFDTPLDAQAPDWWAPRGPTYEEYDIRPGNGRQGNGPPFCRNGQGHPVHGMAWCQEKGWARVGWTDVVFGGQDRRYDDPYLRQPTLIDILGDVVLGRVLDQASSLGLQGDMLGRWVRQDTGPEVLQLRIGDSPLAEFTDMDRDGRADVVLMIDPS